MINILFYLKKSLNKKRKTYLLNDTFGCPECPPQDCPTFLERSIHRQFRNALSSYNIIVVYGESRQGKTWTIEKYCPQQLRIGCTANMNLNQIKIEMLHKVGKSIRQIEHSITDEIEAGGQSSTKIGNDLLGKAGLDTKLSTAHTETIRTTYSTVDMTNNAEFLETLKRYSSGNFSVFDNFHYLTPVVQQQFCSLLKEFNYQNIKIIIVGVWKDASRITAMAPDLVNRCEHIDIGAWSENELDDVVEKGEKALNIVIDDESKRLFKKCCANNIGIFKDFLQRYCREYDIYETQGSKKILYNSARARSAAETLIEEAYVPLHDRIKNLATPQRERKESKHMRLKIVDAILQLIIENDIPYTQAGLPLEIILEKIHKISLDCGENQLDISNIVQELGVLHNREENRQTGSNYIPLFFYDRTNRKLLVIEPTIYMIKSYNCYLLQSIVDELENSGQDQMIVSSTNMSS